MSDAILPSHAGREMFFWHREIVPFELGLDATTGKVCTWWNDLEQWFPTRGTCTTGNTSAVATGYEERLWISSADTQTRNYDLIWKKKYRFWAVCYQADFHQPESLVTPQHHVLPLRLWSYQRSLDSFLKGMINGLNNYLKVMGKNVE